MTRVPAPSTSRLRGEAGVALTEAIAAAAVLAFLALGVLAGLDGAASSTGREKARSVASALAERDQERLHAMRAQDLPGLRETDAVTVGGIEYTVTSEADWISDSTGGTMSCTSSAGKADYLRLKTVVTSATVGRRTAPVELESIVTPPQTAAGGNTGTLAVQVIDRDDEGVPGRTVSIKGTDSGYTDYETTNALGCAIFARATADTYDVWVDEPNWVDKDGNQRAQTASQVNVGSTTITSIVYDRAGTVTTAFDTTWWDPKTDTARTTASRAWSLALGHSGLSAGIRRFPAGTAPKAVMVADNLFPFKTNYTIHTGACIEENPGNIAGVPAEWLAANAFQQVDPGLSYDRRTAPAAPVRQPALPLRIAYGRLPYPNADKWSWVDNASVVAKLIPPSSSSQCRDEELVRGLASDATYGLRSYPTGRVHSGTAPHYLDGLMGMVTKAPVAGFEFDPGLPFGTWQVCAHKRISDTNRRAFAFVDNTHTGVPPTIFVLDLRNAATASIGSCPTTADSSAWPAPPTA